LMAKLSSKKEDFLRSFFSGALIGFLGQGREWFESFANTMYEIIDALEQAEEPVNDLRDRLDRAVDRFREIEESKHISESHKETLSSKFPEILEIIVDIQDLSRTLEERAKSFSSLFERIDAVYAYFSEKAGSS